MEGNPRRATSGRLLGCLPNPTLPAKTDRGVGKKEVANKVISEKRREEIREEIREERREERREKREEKKYIEKGGML
jgi:hypothetical protein